jgi:excisionase family DNA binding protein
MTRKGLPVPHAKDAIDPDRCLVIGVPEAGEMLGLTRNAAYAAAKRGEIPTIRIGKLLRVPKAAFEKMLRDAGAR